MINRLNAKCEKKNTKITPGGSGVELGKGLGTILSGAISFSRSGSGTIF